MLDIIDLNKSIQEQPIVKDINVSVKEGELLVVVGPSGCGKSTLLRMIAGLEETTSGEILLEKKSIIAAPAKDRNIAMVFQNYALYPHMTVYQNMAYGLKMRNVDKTEIKERVEKAAETLHLKHLLQRKPNQLSGGQRQRVAMGRAIVRKPKIFLFDEPLSNLDANLRVKMRLEINRLQRQLGITSIYVTHDQVEAMTLADRILVVNNGRAEQIGMPLEIYRKPRTRFVAEFIGSPPMNFIPGRMLSQSNTIAISEDYELALPDPHHGSMTDREVAIGIRAEDIELRLSNGEPQIYLSIDRIESLGSETLVYGCLPGTKAQLTVKLSRHHDIQLQDQIPITLPVDQIHIFDKESGMRL